MGKIRKSRKKLHLQAVNCDQKKDQEEDGDSFYLNESSLPAIFPVKGLFENKASAGNDVDDQAKSEKKQSTTKLSKRKERHQKFLNKLNASRAVEDTAKQAKERAKTVIIGDMQPMLTALPTVTPAPASQMRNSALKAKGSRSKKARKKMQMADLETFQQVLSHPAFKSNPLGAISEHLKNAVNMEQENLT